MTSPLIRSGMKIRRLVADVNRAKKGKYVCPTCGKKKVRRKSFALYECASCKSVFAGAAYSLSTNVGTMTKNLIAQANSKN